MNKLPVISEHSIRNSILDLLRYNGVLCWTNNSGGMKGEYTDKYGITRKRFTRFGGIPGASDIFAVHQGKFICIEVKTPATKNKATRFQLDFIQQVVNHGGIGFVASSVDEVAEKLGIKGLF